MRNAAAAGTLAISTRTFASVSGCLFVCLIRFLVRTVVYARVCLCIGELGVVNNTFADTPLIATLMRPS